MVIDRVQRVWDSGQRCDAMSLSVNGGNLRKYD